MKCSWIKKSVCYIIVGVMVGLLGGCGNENKTEKVKYSFNETGYPIVNEPITLKVAVANAATAEVGETELVKYIAKEMGITLECVPYTGGEWSKQFTLLLASDELPDLVVNASTSISAINENGLDDYFLPLNDYLKYAPNLKKAFKQFPTYETLCTAEDGNIYGLTQIDENIYNRVNRCFIDKRWLKNVGMNMPTNVEELYKVLKAFKEKDANGNGDVSDEVPMTDIGGYQRTFVPILNAFGISTLNLSNGRCVNDDGKLYFPYITNNYRAYLEYMNRLYDEELIDKSVFTRTFDEVREMSANEKIGMYGCAAPYVYAGKGVEYDANFSAVMGLTSDYCKKAYIPMTSEITGVVKAVISSKTNYPEACVRLIDYFFTQEGALNACLGVEGVTYDMVEKAYAPGVKVQQMKQPEGFSSPEQYRINKATISSGFDFWHMLKGDQPEIVSKSSEEVLYGDEMIADFGWYVLMERRMREVNNTVEAAPSLSYTKSEGKKKSTISTDISTYVKQITTQFITGKLELTDNNWKSYVKTVKQMGLDEWFEVEQSAYDRMYRK